MTGLLRASAAALGLMVATPMIAPTNAQVAPAATPAVETRHADWTLLLQTYISTDETGLNRFDYGALADNTADRRTLDQYISRIARQDWDALTRDEQFAAWGNLYNAVTIRYIVNEYPVDSIKDGYLFGGPWDDVKVFADGRQVSLDDIEHGILREDWDDPRIHYMVNCASIGCPNLKATAWEAATLDAELDDAARAFINHPRGVTVRDDGRLRVSSIYKWFKEDFGGNEAGVIDHLLEYADDGLAAQIEARRDIRNYDYDWDLNDVR